MSRSTQAFLTLYDLQLDDKITVNFRVGSRVGSITGWVYSYEPLRHRMVISIANPDDYLFMPRKYRIPVNFFAVTRFWIYE